MRLSDAPNTTKERFFHTALWLVFFLLLIPTYWAIIRFHYTVSPGADTFAHLQTVANNRINPLHWVYPPQPELFQAIIAFLVNLTKLPVTQTYTWLAALAIPCSALSLTYLAKELFGRRTALLCLLLFVFVSLQPWQTYTDGTIPNIIAIGVLTPLFFLWLTRAFNRQGRARARAVGMSLMLFLTILYTHHLSTLIVLAVLLAATTLLVIHRAITARTLRSRLQPLEIYLATLIVFVYLFLNSSILAPARTIFTIFLSIHPSWPFFTVNLGENAHPWNSFLFGQDLGGVIVQFGILGLLILTLTTLRSTRNRFANFLIISWFSIYIIGATVTWSGEPSRLARDLALPGCILAALALNWSYHWLQRLRPRLGYVLIGATLISSLPYLPHKLIQMTSESSLHYFEAVDEEAYAMLTKDNLLADTTVVSPNFFWQSVIMARQPNLSPQPSVVLDGLASATEFTQSRCVMVVQYKTPVLSPRPTPENFTSIVLGTQYTPVQYFESTTRKITFACRNTVAKRP